MDPDDPASSIDGIARLATDNRAAFERQMGREPTDAELYLMHQQGSQGGINLLLHPNTPAGAITGTRAVSLNGGDPRAPASQFAGMWLKKFDGAPDYFRDRVDSPGQDDAARAGAGRRAGSTGRTDLQRRPVDVAEG